MSLMDEYLPRVRAYVDDRDWRDVPEMCGRSFTVAPLAQGEYNLNYCLSSANGTRRVLRVNLDSQIARSDQITYEYQALRLLSDSGYTPRSYFVDDSRSRLDRGVLIMEFLPGEPLRYDRDLEAAAELFAGIHQVPVAPEQNHLIVESAPLSLIFEECRGLLQHYCNSTLADPEIRSYLRELQDWADRARAAERFYQQDPWLCIVNTEVNSGNFLVDRTAGRIYLVDWEMPRWGDPSQDLCHFCSPLTTLWKTDYRMSAHTQRAFIDTYRRHIQDAHLRDTLTERIRLRDPFVYLRGISWSAMGWVAYQTEFSGTRNPDTWKTLQRYMNLDFIRSLFDPFLKQG
ncbi:MAG TPA: phosphotransferase family protein [Desulfobacterales bacterium]